MVGRFVLVAPGASGLPFFFGGMALTLVFKHDSGDIPRLYMADLLGAGLGVVVAVLAMNALGTPVAVAWIPLPALLAALPRRAGAARWLVPAGAVVAAGRALRRPRRPACSRRSARSARR